MADGKKSSGSGSKRIIDVAHPDETAPSGNSKSVIVSNRPILQDPMVVPGDQPAEPETDVTADKSALVTKAKPPELKSELTAESEPEPESKPKPAETAKPAPAAPEAAETAAARPAAGTNAVKADTEAEEEPAEKTPQTAAEDAKQISIEAEAKAKQQALVDKLSDSKKYYLPIDTVEKRRSRRFVAGGILLSLLLIVAWADIALDAGLIHLGGVKPVTHFFSN